MRPTRWPVLLAVTVVSAALAYVAVRRLYGDLPVLPRYAPASLLLLAVAEAVSASAIRARIQRRARGRPISPLTVARTAALAKASSLTGALAVGVYGALLTYTLVRRGELAAARGDAVTSGLGVAAGLVLTAAALWLERCCRIPRPPSSSGPDSGGPSAAPPARSRR